MLVHKLPESLWVFEVFVISRDTQSNLDFFKANPPFPDDLTHWSVPFEVIGTKYATTQFIPALSWFIAQYQHPEYSKAQVEVATQSIHIPFSKVSVFHHIKFISYDVYSLNPLDKIVVDSIHVDPVHFNKYRKVVPGRFNTAVIQVKDYGNPGLKGMFLLVVFFLFIRTATKY